MNYDLRHVRAFMYVAEELHFNNAANRLHLSQSALSRTIRDLESALEVKLLERTTRRVALTEAGKAFLAEIHLGLVHIDRAAEVARHAAAGTAGELRVAYNDFAINGNLPSLIREFRQSQPRVRLLLDFVPTSTQKEALIERTVDIGFLIGPFEDPNISTKLIDEDSFVVLLPEGHRLESAETVCLTDLAEEPFVLGTAENWTALRDRLFTLCRQAGYFPAINQEASNSEGIFGLVAAGMGVSVYAGCVRSVHRKGVVIRTLDDVTERIPICAAWNSGSTSTTLSMFTQFMEYEWKNGA